MRAVTIAAALLAGLFPSVSSAVECGLSNAFSQTDVDAPGGKTSVWAATGGPLFFEERLNVNTDGTRRSYSVGDFWGETRAINNLCNAMRGYCAELATSEQKRQRRIATQAAEAAGWPAAQLAATRISSAVIPFKNGKPCPAVDGYLVSATALHVRNITDICDQNSYVDALAVPALVLPLGATGFNTRNARIGDLVVAAVPGSDRVVFGVVGDAGPSNKLGEASVAMNGALLGLSEQPTNFKDVKKRWGVKRAAVLIFPGTRDVQSPYLTRDRIEAAASPLFQQWGGVERLQACATAYPGG